MGDDVDLRQAIATQQEMLAMQSNSVSALVERLKSIRGGGMDGADRAPSLSPICARSTNQQERHRYRAKIPMAMWVTRQPTATNSQLTSGVHDVPAT